LWVIFKIPSSSIVRTVMCAYLCSVIIQVIVTVMKKTTFEKRYKGGKERRFFRFKEEKNFSPYYNAQDKLL